jgi:hypothetical protein
LQKPTDVKEDNFISRYLTDSKAKELNLLRATLKKWKTCPKQDGFLDSIFICMAVDGGSGLGNQVSKQIHLLAVFTTWYHTQIWSYLSVWAIARRHNIRPVLPEHNLDKISKMFDRNHFNVPSLLTVGIKCKLLPWIIDEYRHGTNSIGRPKDLFRRLQVPLKQNVTMIKVVRKNPHFSRIECMVLHFSVFLLFLAVFCSLIFLLLKVTFYDIIHPKKEVHSRKLTTFAYFTGKTHFLQFLWGFLMTSKNRKKNNISMIVCE